MKQLRFENDARNDDKERIGGGAFIGGIYDWPRTPEGIALSMICSLPATFVSAHSSINIGPKNYVSVFSYYSESEYFLDSITYHGTKDELETIRSGYTKVLIHGKGQLVRDGVQLPEKEIEVIDADSDGSQYAGSKIDANPYLIQNEEISISTPFFLQIYSSDFPAPYEDIFGTTDAVGYLYLDADSGMFFTQVS